MEVKGLVVVDLNGFSDFFVKLNLGLFKVWIFVKYKELNFIWREDFVFVIEDVDEEFNIEVWDEDMFVDDFLG